MNLSPARLPAFGSERCGYHFILVLCDVRASRSTEVEHDRRAGRRLRVAEIAGHEAPDILTERHTQIAGPLPSPPLNLGLENDLGAGHDDDFIIRQ